MHEQKTPNSTWLSGLLLAAVTIFVFSTLQNYGPQSAIRRFHVAALAGDESTLSQLSVQPPEAPATVSLVNVVRSFVGQGAQYQLLEMDRQPSGAAGVVAYVFPNRPPISLIWIVKKETAGWRVDATQTIVANRRVPSNLGL